MQMQTNLNADGFPKYLPRVCNHCGITYNPKTYNQKYCCTECRMSHLNKQISSTQYRKLFYDGEIGEARERQRRRKKYPPGLEWMSKFEEIIKAQIKTGKSYGQLQQHFEKR